MRAIEIHEGSAAPFSGAHVIVRVLLKRALAKKHGDQSSDRNSVIDKMDVNDPRFVSAVDSAKPLVLSEIRKLLKGNWWYANIQGWENILALHQVGFEWPELMTMLEDNKSTVIKSMLTAIKSDDAEEMVRWPQIFKDMGIRWPELDIINKSLSTIKGAEQLNEDWGSIYDNTIFRLLANITGQKSQAEPYEPTLDSHREEIYDYLRDRANMWDKDGIFVIRDMRTISALGYYGREWPELVEIVENHKVDVIKMLLGMMKSSEWDHSDVQHEMEQLRKLNINWPEFDIIERSINIESGKLDESDDDFMVRVVRHMSDGFDARRSNLHANIFPLNMLSRFDQMISDRELTTSEVKAALDSIKEKVIPYLLIETKKGQVDQREVLRNINELRGFGIDWPELAVIERSLKADLGEINEDDTISQEQRQINFAYHQFLKCLEHEESDDIAYWLASIGKNDLPTPMSKGNVYWTLRQHKPAIMTSVLSAIKNADAQEFDDDDLKSMIYALRKMHVDWPELNTIQRSLEIDAKQRYKDETV